MGELQPNIQLSRPPLLCLGCARTGTASLAEALRTLGFDKIHHGQTTNSLSPEWKIFDRASDATFPVLPTFTNKSFTRTEWDEWCKHWDVVTDMASFFATSLIPAYPDAKVIIVERDFEAWFKSWTAAQSLWASESKVKMITKLENRCSIRAGIVSAKFNPGWVGVSRIDQILDKGTVRKAYDRHYAYIRETVPKELLLDFKLSEGWAPLCAFLGKEVPEQPFPHVNEAAAYERRFKVIRNENLKRLAKTFVPGGKKRVAAANQREADQLLKDMNQT